ncbi:MAG: LysM peptidoglycan-binding domain-containing protein [Planctomycetota bacterium]
MEKGDLGFEVISKKVYGSGKHWKLIRDANPGVDTNNLQVGQELKIPPLPREDDSRPAPSDRPAGWREYVVQKGDNGFSVIAANVYGDGTLWPAIAKANPGVESTSLRPDQVLLIPPKPEKAPEPPAGPAGGIVFDGPARKYRVRLGDAGFWAISQEVYGTWQYWDLIRDANPGVDSRRLREGQELIIPELTEELKKKYGRPSAPAPESSEAEPAEVEQTSPSSPPRPIFD